MPEFPDVVLYIERLQPRILGQRLEGVRLVSPFLLRTVQPRLADAALHVVRGAAALAALDPGGVEVLDADGPASAAALQRENRTLKRALTNPRLVSGIGNAYSDEILHRARLSPLQRTQHLDAEGMARRHLATCVTLAEWLARLRRETGAAFPDKVTAFRTGMAVHGRFGQPCPVCGRKVQRIVYAENGCHYCAVCRTGGKLLADRALSRLLREDWPRTLEELEEMKSERAARVQSPPEGAEA